jgi:hypothetical protein
MMTYIPVRSALMNYMAFTRISFCEGALSKKSVGFLCSMGNVIIAGFFLLLQHLNVVLIKLELCNWKGTVVECILKKNLKRHRKVKHSHRAA